MARVVVTEENEVEAGDFSGDAERSVFFDAVGDDAAFFSAVKQADDDIRMLVFL